MKKTVCLSLLLLALVLLLASCSARPLPDGMDEDSAGEAARSVVAQLNAGDCQGVADAFREDLAEEFGVTADAIRDIMETVSDAGAYVKTERTLAVGGKSDSFDEPYAAVAVYCEHEEKDVIYEMSFDTDLNLIGLQVKLK